MSVKFCGARCGKMRLVPRKTNSESKTPLVSLQKAAVTMGGRRVMYDLDWILVPGENWAVFGVNGSGKTTFLRLIGGQQWPFAGNHHQRYYNFGNGPEKHAVYARQNIRLVSPELHDRYQRFNWNPTAWALIATGLVDSPILRIEPNARQVDAIRDLAERLKIGSLINRRFLELSRGEQRKLMLARAVIGSPRILLLDEICDGLDQSARHKLLGFIDDLARTGVQLVFAAHRRQELPLAINRYLILRDGGIVETGAPDELRDDRATDLAANTKAGRSAQRASDRSESALIAIENANIYRGETRVLKALNWQLQPRQSWLVRGENGSGKSTLIKLLHAEIRPALGGRISWFGMRSPVNVWHLRKRLGLVSDELQSSYSDLVTVYECVATGFFASIGRIPYLDSQQRRCIDEWLDRLELGAMRKTSISQLSYGQFRRVLIARAMAQRPEILLLDEPMSGLDSDSTGLIWSLLSRFIEQGTALVMASHEAEISVGLFSHRLSLKDGRAAASRLF